MPTIPMKKLQDANDVAREVYGNIMRTYGSPEPHGIYQLMGHTPDFLAASWPRSRYLFGADSCYTLRDKHVMTLAISATNNCEYCVRIHTARLFQLGLTREQLIELLMVVDVMNGFDKFAEGIRLGSTPLIPPASSESPGSAAAEPPGSSREWDDPEADSIYDLMQYDATYVRTSRERARLCFGQEGRLGVRLKHLIAFCVAATNSNDHFVGVHLRRLRALGCSDAELVEAILIVDLSCGYNRYVQGLQVELERKPFGKGAEADKARSVAQRQAT